jgi:hypothetical protein
LFRAYNFVTYSAVHNEDSAIYFNACLSYGWGKD